MTRNVRIGFAGAGGVGCYFGGMMANAGFDITLIGRGPHIHNISNNGLVLTVNDERLPVKLSTVDTGDVRSLNQVSELEWIFITCKAHQSETLMETLRPFINPMAKIVSLQNGVDGPLVLQNLLKREVMGGLSIRFVAHVTSAGEVTASGDGYVSMGPYPTGQRREVSMLVSALRSKGLDFRETDNIRRELWRKIVINNGVNPLCAVIGKDTGHAFSVPELSAIIDTMMREAAASALADDVILTDADVAELRAIIFDLGHVKPSMLVDVEHGRQPEINAISGAVIARAQKLGIKVPVTATIHRLLSARSRD